MKHSFMNACLCFMNACAWEAFCHCCMFPSPHAEGCSEQWLIFCPFADTGMCDQMPSREATLVELLQVHTADHLKSLQAYCSGVECGVRMPSDTYVNEHTLKCATLAAGSAAQAAVAVATGKASCAAAIVRPPGEMGKPADHMALQIGSCTNEE